MSFNFNNNNCSRPYNRCSPLSDTTNTSMSRWEGVFGVNNPTLFSSSPVYQQEKFSWANHIRDAFSCIFPMINNSSPQQCQPSRRNCGYTDGFNGYNSYKQQNNYWVDYSKGLFDSMFRKNNTSST